ncbi:ankyrin repeat-containing domain protein, partial [Mycena latifolia]
ALQAASARGHAETIRLLLDHGADIDLPCRLGTALQLAAFFGHKESVYLLVSRGANDNVNAGWHGTALVAASVQNHYDIVDILLEHGANIDAESDRYIHASSMAGHQAIYDLLIERGATPLMSTTDSFYALAPIFSTKALQRQKRFSSTAPIFPAAIPYA